MKFASLFCGIGGFELGLQALGHECVFASEFDPKMKIQWPQITYEKNFGVKPHGDITKIEAQDVPNHDILTAGFPCQAFSVAGKRKGFEDTRGTMFFEIARIVKVKKPKWLILENVKGLKSHDKGRTFQIIINQLHLLGYGIDWRVLTTADFGPPQKRERVFIVCKRGAGVLWNFNWPKPTVEKWGCVADIMEPEVDGKYFLNQMEKTIAFGNKMRSNGVPFPNDIKKPSLTLTALQSPTGRCTMLVNPANPDWFIKPKDYKRLVKVAEVKREKAKYFQSKDDIYSSGSVSKSLTSNHDAEIMTGLYATIVDSRYNIRRLTPRECARLQGFPDSFKIEVADTQAYKQFGNAVSVPVITAIAKAIEAY